MINIWSKGLQFRVISIEPNSYICTFSYIFFQRIRFLRVPEGGGRFRTMSRLAINEFSSVLFLEAFSEDILEQSISIFSSVNLKILIQKARGIFY